METVLGDLKTDGNNGDGKFENISDNGSEISDEGYRSLGVIQANSNNNNNNSNVNQTKRASLNSQTSTEDAELNGKFYFFFRNFCLKLHRFKAVKFCQKLSL